MTKGDSAAGIPQLRFNSDTGAASYSWNAIGIIAAAPIDAQDSSDDAIQLTGTTTDSDPMIVKIDVTNFSDTMKPVFASLSRVDAVATNPELWTTTGGWFNTSQSITSVEFSRSAGDFSAGARLIVLGTS
jgi:hypothetical protein